MNRLAKFNSVFGENWVVGRFLLPELKRLGVKQRGVLLDLACGESPFRCYFPRVDAYLRIDRSSMDPEVTHGDMRAIPLATQSVDVIMLFQAITDVPKTVDVLKEARRVLKPEGLLLVFESMAYPEHDAPYDFYRLMPEGLRALAADAGLNLRDCRRLGGLFTRFASLWNSFVMGELKRYVVLRPLAHLGVAGCNLLCYALDRMAPHPRLASDYLAELTVDAMFSEVLTCPSRITE
jgi:SAM-dependent methyltransferase